MVSLMTLFVHPLLVFFDFELSENNAGANPKVRLLKHYWKWSCIHSIQVPLVLGKQSLRPAELTQSKYLRPFGYLW